MKPQPTTFGLESEGFGSPHSGIVEHLRNKTYFGLLVPAMTSYAHLSRKNMLLLSAEIL